MNRVRGLLGFCKSDVVWRGSADEPLSPVAPRALSFSSNMLNNGSCLCGCGGQAREKDGASDAVSCAAVRYLWSGRSLLCTAW